MQVKGNALTLLKQNGYKVTKQRRDMLLYLSQFQHSYINVTAVDGHMRALYPGMSHNTIYRNIKAFAEIGIVEQRNRGEQATVKYQCDFEHPHHHHFICRNCGKVIELTMCPLDFFSEQIPDCEIDSHNFELYGLCGTCKQKLK
ncbi:Fur family transcriptional regulator [Loigolactobacillus backii]|uniref:Transcriptional repressor n=1 Tax=Loigolactobacillus backii TaxID=375175 RepID=A0A192H051_9LACO|nr:transcriptional repressor [Loigolactobacillus backii]ANK61346.1 transcriptional repressor [Loigolactobacillus backii]ANK69454.1 transcriptional repressor [Loigolactobacillus backii]MDA5387436.1 transcriptional repressor [Loigolactobacillus backii]MDA5389975.1 transcriptional repressor [Loigolactobacillus backii]